MVCALLAPRCPLVHPHILTLRVPLAPFSFTDTTTQPIRDIGSILHGNDFGTERGYALNMHLFQKH